jgi:MoaA/NifB/PqqE/SkfB family radical SAM enzyme
MENKINRIYLTGGEPFLSKNLWYLLKKCKENQIIVEDITTNGTLLNYLSLEKIRLLNDVVKDIIVSIDSADPLEHDINRGVSGTFNKLEEFFEDREKRKLFKVNFSFNVVVHKKNIYELKKIIEIGLKWKIRHINFQPVNPDSIFPDLLKNNDKEHYVNGLDVDTYVDSLKRLYFYARKQNICTNLKLFSLWTPLYFKYLRSDRFFFNELLKKHICSKVFNFILINYNGDIIPCTNLKPIANIDDEDYLEQWKKNGQKLKLLFKEGKYFEQCKTCFCDFPYNFRLSLLYFPVSNLKFLFQLCGYYLERNKIIGNNKKAIMYPKNWTGK